MWVYNNLMFRAQNKGFTLIELLVVIPIIVLLSSIVLASVKTAREKAQIARAKTGLYQFTKAVNVAQGEAGKTLMTITGSNCSDCGGCRTGAVLKGDNGTCYSAWINVITRVQANTNGIVTGLTYMMRDPWGSPYALDENQGEGGACTALDSLRSVGPNGIWGDGDDILQAVTLSAVCP